MGHKQSACMNDWCCTTCGKDGHKRNECTSPLSSASDQSDASSDEFSSVDNDDDAQTESGVHESTQSDSVDDVKEGDVAPPTISNSKPVNNDIKQTAPQHGVKTKKKSRKKKKQLDRRIILKVHNHKYLVSLVVKKTSQTLPKIVRWRK